MNGTPSAGELLILGAVFAAALVYFIVRIVGTVRGRRPSCCTGTGKNSARGSGRSAVSDTISGGR
jgi:hypothetical protein